MYPMRHVRTRVLPDPGPARTMIGPRGVVTAFRCSLFRLLSIGDRGIGALPACTVDIPSCCAPPFPTDSSDWSVSPSLRLQKDLDKLGSARRGKFLCETVRAAMRPLRKCEKGDA